MGTLYIVPTPIGNLEDITLRALRTLREVSLIAAEDTRQTRILLDRYEIQTRLTSYHEHNKLFKLEALFDALATGDVALVSDAGTPGISDPGYELIREAVARGVLVVPLPGASAVITALVASGLPTDGFVFLGFLPRKPQALARFLSGIREERRTLIAYESPNRLVESLQAVQAALGDRPVAVARELTKLHEEIFRGPVSGALARFTATEPRGEIVLVIGGAPAPDAEPWDEEAVRGALAERLAEGLPRKEAARVVAELAHWNKRDVYNLPPATDGA
jgi:16S rRNA (cytidine1402-2'-O)-methyltransferase